MKVPSVVRHPRLVGRMVRYPNVARLGWIEAFGDGRTYDDDPWSARSEAYDAGRDLRRLGRA